MFLAVTVIVGLVGLLASLVYLLDFARASRGDTFYQPATTGRTRRARFVTGMYSRSGETTRRVETFHAGAAFGPAGTFHGVETLTGDEPFGDEATLVALPHSERLAAH
jgi:hypothetical protein